MMEVRKKENKIIKNASWIIICRIGQAILSLVVTMITARFLGPSNYGLINYAAAIVVFITPIVQLGLGSVQVQELVNHREEEGKIVGSTLIMSFGAAVVCFFFLGIFVHWANGGEGETLLVCMLYSILLFFQGSELMQYWFQCKYLSKYASIVSLVAFAIVSVYKIIILMLGKSIYWFAISNSLDYLLIEGMLLYLYKRFGGIKLEFSFEVSKRLLNKGKHYILANMMIVVFTQTDRIMIKNMLGDAETGFYTAATTCACLANFVFLAIIDSARPTILEDYNVSEVKFEKGIAVLYSVVIYLSILINFMITIFAPIIIGIVYGEGYQSAITPLRLVTWFTTFSFIGSIRNIWILAKGQQKWLWLINVSGAVINVILNLVLINQMGVIGAAIASLVSQFVSNIAASYVIRDTRDNFRLMIMGMKPSFLFRNILKPSFLKIRKH